MLNYFKNRFFRDTFLMYISIMSILILLVYITFVYQKEMENKERVLQEAQASAELMTQIIDDKFSTIELVATHVGASSWSPYLASQSEILNSKVDYFKKKEILKELGVFNDILRIAKSTAVLFPKRNLAVDRKEIWECERYFKSIDLDSNLLDTVKEKLEGKYGAQVLFSCSDSENSSGDFCILKQIDYDQSSRMVLFVLVDAKQFVKYIETNLVDAEEFQICYENEVIFSYEKSDVKGSEQFGITLPSTLYQWEYRFKVGASFYQDTFVNVSYIVLGCLFLMVAAIVVSYMLARLTYRPIGALLERFGVNVQERFHGLEGLENIFLDLQNQKEGMEELANQYYMIGQNSFFTSLLKGTYDEEKIGEYVQKFHTEFSDNMMYQVIAFADIVSDSEKRKPLMDISLKLQMDCYYQGITAVVSYMEGCLLLIMGYAGSEQKLIMQSERISELAKEYLAEKEVGFYIGEPYKGFKGIHRSYKEMKAKFAHNKIEEKQLTYFYPFDVEVKLIKCLQLANFQEAALVLDQIREENTARKLMPEVECKVIGLIYETFCRYALELNLAWNEKILGYQEMREVQDMEGLWNVLEEQLREIINAYNRSHRFLTIGSSLVEYVEQHYMSSGLSQQDIADHFGVSRPTVSKLFKETVNMNFIDYLHMMRVEAAKRLIDERNFDMMDVARKCGYENEVTFRRAFVKHVGVTPQQYIKSQKMGEKRS